MIEPRITSSYEHKLQANKMKNLLETFYSQIVELPSGCHIWTGAMSKAGYGQIMTNGKTHFVCYTHIFAFILEQKRLPRHKHDIHHTCENPICCNPIHLEELTRYGHKRKHVNYLKCKRGHDLIITGKYKSGRCKACVSEENKKYAKTRVYYR